MQRKFEGCPHFAEETKSFSKKVRADNPNEIQKTSRVVDSGAVTAEQCGRVEKVRWQASREGPLS